MTDDPSDTLSAEIARVRGWLADATGVVVLTGSGISAESRIPTFRDNMEGLWAEFDPQKLATPEAFDADPELVTRWYDMRRVKCLEAEPNPGHTALAEMQRQVAARGGSFTLLTQNVDGLHQRAGSTGVVELHGSITAWRGVRTARPFDLPHGPMDVFPPTFDDGEFARPGVVWFGENLPEDAIAAAYGAIESCDLFFTIGTSSVVYPAAGFVDIASARGAKTVEINPAATPATTSVDAVLAAKAGEALPRLV
ncbi:MAG: NAD-dependent deacylase [Planctomycetota bacterium]